MIEVFPKKINQEKIKVNYQKLIAAFLIVARDMDKELSKEQEDQRILTVSGPVFSKNTGKI